MHSKSNFSFHMVKYIPACSGDTSSSAPSDSAPSSLSANPPHTLSFPHSSTVATREHAPAISRFLTNRCRDMLFVQEYGLPEVVLAFIRVVRKEMEDVVQDQSIQSASVELGMSAPAPAPTNHFRWAPDDVTRCRSQPCAARSGSTWASLVLRLEEAFHFYAQMKCLGVFVGSVVMD